MNSIQVHPFFSILCEKFLYLDPKMTKRLWAKLYPSEVTGLILQAEFYCRAASPEGIELLARRLNAALLLQACRRLAPEDGRPRDPEVVEVEELILSRTGPDGRWV
jgi:hypothetical protein